MSATLPDLVALTIAHLKSGAIGLRSVEAEAELAELLDQKRLPQQMPAAFVIPEGFTGAPVKAATGPHRQTLTFLTGTVLVYRHAGDASGAKAATALVPVINAVIKRVAGWVPEGAKTAMEIRRGELTGMSAGAVFYALQFACDVSVTGGAA